MSKPPCFASLNSPRLLLNMSQRIVYSLYRRTGRPKPFAHSSMHWNAVVLPLPGRPRRNTLATIVALLPRSKKIVLSVICDDREKERCFPQNRCKKAEFIFFQYSIPGKEIVN